MTSLLLIALIAVGVVLYQTQRELNRIRRRLDDLENRPFGAVTDTPVAEIGREPEHRVAAKGTARRSASVSRTPTTKTPSAEAPSLKPELLPSRFSDLSFENLVGGKLPIWVGGISLVFAGFFLVRYTIEAGLFGPGARSITATIFALAMIAMSELGGRLPKIGASFTADPRVGQSLAGAGVATLYGTLYMAAEIYGLIGVPTAFILIVVVTAMAFALSLRHGPPTALMGLIGGFAAPWVAGMGESNLPTLLLYLAVFVAALFGLAVWRRWFWLLVLASGGGLAWSLAMLVSANSNLGLLGGFIAVTGGGAILAMKRFDEASDIWAKLARYAPLALALVQLALLLPKMEFSATAWMLYFALSVLAIALAWRDKSLLPLVAGALLLAVFPLGLAWSQNGASQSNIAATLAIAALFGLTGHVRARRSDDASTYWAIIALAAPVLSWFTASLSHQFDADQIWAGLALLASLPAAYTAWEWHATRRGPTVQPWAAGTAALMLWAAAILLVDEDWSASYSAIIALAVAAWARVTGGRWERQLSLIPLTLAILLAGVFSWQFFDAVGASLSGDRSYFGKLPEIAEAVRATLVPAGLIAAIAWQPLFATGRRARTAALVMGGAGVAAFAWLIAKQAAAISTPADFIRTGFAERAIFTQILFGLGWLAQSKARATPTLTTVGWVLAAVASFRVVWFDLLLLNPVMVPQNVGPVPVANLLTVHLVLTALWLWLLARNVPLRLALAVRGASLGTMIVCVLATIRQAVQGSLISGASIETGENYLYSAGLLALVIGWLIIGISQGSKLLRVAGLLLLTAVTLKAFLIDAAVLTGILRILSFLGLGIALIGIGWAYGRLMAVDKTAKAV